MVMREVRKLTGDETQYWPPGLARLFLCKEKIQCVHFQPSQNQLKGWADKGVSCAASSRTPWVMAFWKLGYFDRDTIKHELLEKCSDNSH